MLDQCSSHMKRGPSTGALPTSRRKADEQHQGQGEPAQWWHHDYGISSTARFGSPPPLLSSRRGTKIELFREVFNLYLPQIRGGLPLLFRLPYEFSLRDCDFILLLHVLTYDI